LARIGGVDFENKGDAVLEHKSCINQISQLISQLVENDPVTICKKIKTFFQTKMAHICLCNITNLTICNIVPDSKLE